MEKVLATIVVLFIMATIMWGSATAEATSFRKLTGRTDVTTWDALWVELRVDCSK